MRIRPSRRSSLFLLELLFAILFFILASTICVRLFVKSHTIETEASDLNHAVNCASSVAELLQAGHMDSCTIFYDENWAETTAEDACYRLVLETSLEDSFLFGNIRISKSDRLLYELDVKYYRPEGGNLS